VLVGLARDETTVAGRTFKEGELAIVPAWAPVATSRRTSAAPTRGAGESERELGAAAFNPAHCGHATWCSSLTPS
jgi:hypothetical protein